MRMTSVEREIRASPERVFAVLADGWVFPVWVVGATHMRQVDDGWPAVGTQLHHQLGAWPLTIDDTTSVLDCDPPRRLRLRARAWPLAELELELTVRPHGDRSSVVRMSEAPVRGAGRLLNNPLARRVLAARNRETLARLATIAENRE